MLLIVVFGLISVYHPLSLFINWFLPEYTDSIPIFRIILPGIAISSSITALMHNYYKVLGLNIEYFKKCVVVLLISGIANTIAYLFYHSTQSISIASVVTMIVWFNIIEKTINKEIKSVDVQHHIYLYGMLSAFYVITIIKNSYIGFFVYIFTFFGITWMFYKNLIKCNFSFWKNSRKNA